MTKIDRSEICHLDYLYQELTQYQTHMNQLQKQFHLFEKEFYNFEKINFNEKNLIQKNYEIKIQQIYEKMSEEDERIQLQCSKIQQDIKSFENYVETSFLPLTEQLKVSFDSFLFAFLTLLLDRISHL